MFEFEFTFLLIVSKIVDKKLQWMNAELLQKEMRIEYPISIAVIDDMEIASFIKGYYVYQKTWKPVLKRTLSA